jgi:hypothetical protein
VVGVLRDRVAEVVSAVERLEATAGSGDAGGVRGAVADVRREVDALNAGLAALEPQGTATVGSRDDAG